MRKNSMMKKLKLEEASFVKIQEAVKKAEKNTTGEIAVAVTPESARYSVYELGFSLFIGMVVFAFMLPFSASLSDMLDRWYWGAPAWQLPAFFGITSFGLVGIFFLVANIPFIDRLIIPKDVRAKTVYNRALQHFVESGVYATNNRSGILIFVSYMEREVRILADTGINEKIPHQLWNLIAVDLAEGLGTEDAAGAFIRAIERCGELLEEHFPLEEGVENPDELPDGLVILGDDECL
ncbi:MAG: TPM domain-containing protein [Spirochaetia bacterium]|nr:TPM domain-containing protein [Spirochaetia bacterium]